MANVRFIGCTHFGHKYAANQRGFQDEYYHDEHLIDSWNSVVNKKDLTIITGDITMETAYFYYQLDRLNGRKKVVLGNHDLGNHIPELLKYVESVHGAYRYKGYMITHIPIHPSEIHFYRANIHSHIHHNKLPDVKSYTEYNDKGSKLKSTKGKYWNVDAHIVDYKPKTLDELRSYYQKI